ncbi:modification methylase, partial [Halobacteriales archaeon QH_10_67_13]
AQERAAGESFDYEAERYDFPVRTKQERSIRLYELAELTGTAEGYAAVHEPLEDPGPQDANPDADLTG